jgi:HTH-type transcriptional regulator/antitoxin HigA
MDVKPIRTEAEHEAALAEIEKLWDAPSGSPECDRLEVLSTLVEAYEEKHHAIDPPDPIDAILFRMDQLGLSRRDLESYIGTRARAAEILNHTRSLTLPERHGRALTAAIPPHVRRPEST